jgi:hypothetical protein
LKAAFFIGSMALLFLVCQTTVAPQIVSALAEIPGLGFLEGHAPDFLLVGLVYLIFHRDLLGALLWAALFGIFSGSFGTAWKGAVPASFLAVALVGSFLKRQVLLETRSALVLLIAGITVLEGLFHLGAGHLFSRIDDPFRAQWGTLATQALVNGVIAIPLYAFLHFFDGQTGGRTARARASLLVDS